MSETFKIATIGDVYNLPTIEQMNECLDELKTLLNQVRLFSDVAALSGGDSIPWPDSIDWHDDGRGEVKTTFKDTESEAQVVISNNRKEGA